MGNNFMKTFKIAAVAVAVTALAGCGENAQIDIEHRNTEYQEDASMLVGYTLPVDQVEGTLLDPKMAQEFTGMLSKVDDLIYDMPYTEEATKAWVAEVESVKAFMKTANMGEFGDKFAVILDDMSASVQARRQIIEKAESREEVMDYLKKNASSSYKSYERSVAKLKELNGFGKEEYSAMLAAEDKYESAKKASDLEPQYDKLVADYVTNNSIPIAVKDIRSSWDVSYEDINEETNKCYEADHFYVAANNTCYSVSFKPFYYSSHYKKLNDQQKADLKKIGESLVEPQIKAYREYKLADAELDKAKQINKDKSAIAYNKFGASYESASKSVMLAGKDLSYRSRGLYDVNNDTFKTDGRAYRTYIASKLNFAAVNNDHIVNSVEGQIKRLGEEKVNEGMANAFFEKATQFEVNSDGSFNAEPNSIIVITSKANVAEEKGNLTFITTTRKEVDEVSLNRDNTKFDYKPAAKMLVLSTKIKESYNRTFG